MKKTKILLALALSTLVVDNSISQMVGADCYIKGNLVEIGIDGTYGFEGADTFVSAPLAGMHFRSNTQYFGFVANPQVNAWATFDGDFFTPGTPENGWGFECITGGVSYTRSNNRAYYYDIPGSLGGSWSMIGTCIQADWNGTHVGGGYNLSFHINYYLNTPDLYYTTTVTVTNNGALIPDFYYYRNFDPDNNIVISGTYTTQNTVVSQPGGTCNLAHVKATSTAPASQPMSYVGMAAVGSQFRVSKGGFSNRDGSDIWNGVAGLIGTVGATSFMDEAISLAYRIQNFAAGASETFKFVVILDDAAATNAINNLFYVTYPGSGASAAICNPTVDTVVTCPGVGVPIGVAGSALASFSWSWSPTTGLSPTTGPSVTAAPTTSTLYTVTGTPLSPCFSPVTQQIYVKVTPPPTITCPAPPTICPGQSATLTASGAGVGGTYSWSPATGLSATTGASVTATPASTTTYTVTGTTAAGCVGTTTVTVNVGGSVPISCTPAAPSICPGASTSLTASGAATYTWSPATGLSATTGTTVTASPAATTTYTITGTSAAGCTGTTTVTVSLNPLPTVTCPSTSVCSGLSTSLTASGASTYTWSPATGLSATSGTTVTASPTATTTYTITGTDALGCTNTGTTTVTVNALPTITCPDATMCPAGSATLTASGGVSYSWGPATGLSATTGTTVTATPPSTTTYTITGTDANGCVNTGTTTVSVGGTAAITVPAATMCSGSSTTLTASGGVTYTWSPATGLSSTTGTSVTATPATTTTYTITGTDALGCSGTTTSTVTVEDVIINSIVVTDALCNGSSDGTVTINATGATMYSIDGGVTFQASNVFTGLPAGPCTPVADNGNGCQATGTATINEPTPLNVPISVTPETCMGSCDGIGGTAPSGGTAPYTYSWTSGATGPFATALCSGTYTVIVTDDHGCTGTGTAVITGPAAVSIISITPTQPSCNGGANGSVVVNASPTVTNFSIDCGATFQPTGTFTGLTSGVYCATVTDAAGCSATQNFTINQPTVLGVSPGATSTVCFGQTATVAASGTGATPGYTYVWTDASGTTVGTAASISVTPTTVGANVYTVNVNDANGCGPVTATVTVTMTPPLAVTASADVSVCPGDAATISTVSATGGTGSGYTYTWTNNVDASALSGSSQSVTPSTGSTTYTVTLSDGCSPSVTDQVVVTWFALPGVTYTVDNNQGCTPVTVNFTNTTVAGGTATYSWNFGDGNTSTSANPTNVFVGDGCYDIGLSIVTADGCAIDTVISNQICVFPIPVPDFTFNPQPTDVFNTEIDFTNLTMGGSTYTWDFAGLGSSTSINPSFEFPNDGGGTYNICLNTVSDNGCTASICHDVIILDQFIMYVPNTFTPDGDGVNDIFLPIFQGEDPLSYEFFIFNRWGEIIFQSNNKQVGWDGLHKSMQSKEDVYVWKIRVKKAMVEEKLEFNGHVNLLR
ncbi:MAG TPA: gliding motility-associated C-terminal domain-containing protein [Flavobacteriales bacterium]|nr:gliding motility-associated C-terminal domain-containing protein [Flavobacteriales bacterium]